jgi:hypothetical protein
LGDSCCLARLCYLQEARFPEWSFPVWSPASVSWGLFPESKLPELFPVLDLSELSVESDLSELSQLFLPFRALDLLSQESDSQFQAESFPGSA